MYCGRHELLCEIAKLNTKNTAAQALLYANFSATQCFQSECCLRCTPTRTTQTSGAKRKRVDCNIFHPRHHLSLQLHCRQRMLYKRRRLTIVLKPRCDRAWLNSVEQFRRAWPARQTVWGQTITCWRVSAAQPMVVMQYVRKTMTTKCFSQESTWSRYACTLSRKFTLSTASTATPHTTSTWLPSENLTHYWFASQPAIHPTFPAKIHCLNYPSNILPEIGHTNNLNNSDNNDMQQLHNNTIW